MFQIISQRMTKIRNILLKLAKWNYCFKDKKRVYMASGKQTLESVFSYNIFTRLRR
jgi:hypothetical protein